MIMASILDDGFWKKNHGLVVSDKMHFRIVDMAETTNNTTMGQITDIGVSGANLQKQIVEGAVI